MTLSLLLHDPVTGEFGAVIASSSPAVAARCLHLADGIGAAASQNITDPRLGAQLLTALRKGFDARTALQRVVTAANPETIEYRQLTVLDAAGVAASYTGAAALGNHHAATARNAVAAGNMLADVGVVDALLDTAIAAEGSLETRLLAGLKAAAQAGGEAGPLHSAGLAVVSDAGWRTTDLRVDWSDADPIAALEALYQLWQPQKAAYVQRGLNPAAAPGYGVPGDDR